MIIRDNDILGNMFLIGVKYDNVLYPSVQNAFEGSKIASIRTRMLYTKLSPIDAFKSNYKHPDRVRNDWYNMQTDIMMSLLQSKFTNPICRQALLDTNDDELIYENNHHDTEWGVCTCGRCNHSGNNRLGQTLMYIRESLKAC